MNTNTNLSQETPSLRLPIAFALPGPQNSWAQPIARTASRRGGVIAARRMTHARNRYALRRFFTPRHTIEHRLP